jgi:5-methylcytosine-specific restriction protein B
MNYQEMEDYFGKLLPDEEVRRASLELLRDHILAANDISPNSWTLYRENKHSAPVFVVLNKYTYCIHIDLEGNETSSILVFVNKDSITPDERRNLKKLGCTFKEGFQTADYGEQVFIPTLVKNDFLASIKIIKNKFPEYIRKLVHQDKKVFRKGLYQPDLVEFLNRYLKKNVPDPEYFKLPPPNGTDITGLEINMEFFTEYFSSKGYSFTPDQIAQFYTGLQTKGFVILSGISGTGKTKLGQHFAEMLSSPAIALVGAYSDPIDDSKFPMDAEKAEYWTYPIREDVKNNLTTPFRLLIYNKNEIGHIMLVKDFVTQPQKTGGLVSPWPNITDSTLNGQIHQPGNPNQTFQTWFRVGYQEKLSDKLSLDQLQPLFNYKNQPAALRNGLIPVVDPFSKNPHLLFLSVRPDWRDSKGLLGYYNPLMKKYEWTPFLRFLLKVVNDYKQNNRQSEPWFLILDEMNLARVEYYFSDLLSVLESGRDKEGWTNEPIRLTIPPEVDNDRPPEEIRLPPNLYIIGTVNVDETTHAFSPKVLDRAFTMELTNADFSAYHPANLGKIDVTEDKRKSLRDGFTRNGLFTSLDKSAIASWVETHLEYRQRLQCLNNLLHPHDMHFGYRVFDEIISFMISADENQLFKSLGGSDSAFDVAVLMKVLPKFHGSRGKLDTPLQSILAWCLNPISPDVSTIRDVIQRSNNDPTLGDLLNQPYLYPKTATRIHRMIVSLYTTGFTAFG